MLKTGEFSKLSGVSVRMLCRYAEIGLLKLAETDRFTDYRYYREDHLPTVCCITALKNMGFSLADIVRILDIYVDKKKLDSTAHPFETKKPNAASYHEKSVPMPPQTEHKSENPHKIPNGGCFVRLAANSVVKTS